MELYLREQVEELNKALDWLRDSWCPDWRTMDVDEVNAIMERHAIPIPAQIDHRGSKYLPDGAIEKLIPLARPKGDRGDIPIFEKTLGCGFTHQALRYQTVRLVIITPNVSSIQRKQEIEGKFDDHGRYHPNEETSHVRYCYEGSVNSEHTKSTFYCTPDWFKKNRKKNNLIYDVIFIDEYHRYVTDGRFRRVCNSHYLPVNVPILGVTATNLGGCFGLRVGAKSINALTPKVTYKINRNTPNSNIDYCFNQFLNEGQIVKNDLIIVTTGRKVIDLLAKAKKQGMRAWCNVGGDIEQDLKLLKDRTMIAEKIEEADFFIGSSAGTEGYDINRIIDTARVIVYNNKEEYIRGESIIQSTGRFRNAKNVICQVYLMGDGCIERITKEKIERWEKEATAAQNLKKEHQTESKGVLFEIRKNKAYEIRVNHPLLTAETERKGINDALGVRETKTNVRCTHKPKTDEILINDHEHIVPRNDDSEEVRKKYIRRCIKNWNKKGKTKKEPDRHVRWALLNLAYIDYDTHTKGLPEGHFLTKVWGVELDIKKINGYDVMSLKKYKPINEVGAECVKKLIEKYDARTGVYARFFNKETKAGTLKNELDELLKSAKHHVIGETIGKKENARAYRAITYSKDIEAFCRNYCTKKDKTGGSVCDDKKVKRLKNKLLKNFDEGKFGGYAKMYLCFLELKGVLSAFESKERFEERVIEMMYLQAGVTKGMRIGNRVYHIATRLGGDITKEMCEFIFPVSKEYDIKSCASLFLMALNGVQPRCPYLGGSYRTGSKKKTNMFLNMEWKIQCDYPPQTKGGVITLGRIDTQEVTGLLKHYSIYNKRTGETLEEFIKRANIDPNSTKRGFISQEVINCFKLYLLAQSKHDFPVKFFHFYTYYEKKIFKFFKKHVQSELAQKMGKKKYKLCFSRLHDGYRVTALYGVNQDVIDKIANNFYIFPHMLGIEGESDLLPFNPFTLVTKPPQEEHKPIFKPINNNYQDIHQTPPKSPLKRIKKGYKFLYHYNPPDD